MHKNGFTLIELLVVVAIIAVFATIVVAGFNIMKAKSHDSRRAADMQQIVTALQLFYTTYGCLPITNGSTCIAGYSESNSGGWDYSSQNGFMTFLQNTGNMARVPLDPINDMTGDGTAGQYAYRYFCYSNGPSLGYWKEYPNRTFVPVLVAGADANFRCR